MFGYEHDTISSVCNKYPTVAQAKLYVQHTF